jgi:pectate lyase
MKKIILKHLSLVSVSALLVFDSLSASAATIPAFPGAEGYGAQTTGGRGGTICEVTNLNDTGAGSLRDCVEIQTGSRTVVFRVGGTIDLSQDIIINAAHSYITIAGQTAPGDGIQLKNAGIYIQDGGHDVVIRYLRVRPGSVACIAQGPTAKACDTVSAIAMWGETIQKRVYNIVLDHVSAQWAPDQNLTVWDSVSDVTIQNSIIAEGATEGHSKGSHSMGFISGGDIAIDTVHPRTISIHHSLFAHNEERNPLIGEPSILDFRNNVIYYHLSWGAADFRQGKPFSSYPASFNTVQCNFINNIYKKNPNNSDNISFMLYLDGQSRVYISGNYTSAYPMGTDNDFDSNNVKGGNASINQLSSPVSTPAITTDNTSEVLAKVLANAGANFPIRDSIDKRIVNDVTKGTGSVGQDQNNWPTLAYGTAPTDTDYDGMPDGWETSHGLNPNDANDGNGDQNSNGYTNVEEYLNQLADSSIPVTNLVASPSPRIRKNGRRFKSAH